MSTIQLTNQSITVTLKSLGAEIISIKDSAGTEYLWQGNPDYWSGQAPVLFPIIGCLRNGKATVSGDKTCSFGRHGIARKKEFALLSSTDTKAVFSLRADEETKEQYPFDFELQMIYELEGSGVKITHKVINHDSVVMPYCVGGHPAFNCPISEGESFEDYVVEFEYPETAHCAKLNEDALIDNGNRVTVLEDSALLPVKHSLFYEDALIFDQLKSRKASLKHKDQNKGICVTFPDFDYLGVWSSANDGPFVVIEPWSGTSTCTDEDDIFEHKRGIRTLEPEADEALSFTIDIL